MSSKSWAFRVVRLISALVFRLAYALFVADAVEKQTRFADQHKLNYKILSDADGAARKVYQVSKAALGLIDGGCSLERIPYKY